MNEEGDEITVEKAASLDEYNIQYLENGEIRKEEWYSNGTMHQLTYYANEDESLESLIGLHSDLNIYYNRQVIGNYKMYDLAYYADGIVESKGKEVHDKNDDIIYSNFEDIKNGLLGKVTKTVYMDDAMAYIMEYNEDGTILSIESYMDDDDFGNAYDAESILQVPGFSWQGLEYFKNALPVLPADAVK